jgi:hypothetical protein
MNVSFGVQQHIIRFDIPVDYSLGVDVSQCTTQFREPESHGFLGEAFSGDMEAKVTACHEIHDNIAGPTVSLDTEIIAMRPNGKGGRWSLTYTQRPGNYISGCTGRGDSGAPTSFALE